MDQGLEHLRGLGVPRDARDHDRSWRGGRRERHGRRQPRARTVRSVIRGHRGPSMSEHAGHNSPASWRQEAERLPNFAPVRFDVVRETTGLVLIDLQYLDAHPEYGLGAPLKAEFPDIWRFYFDRVREMVIPNCQRLLAF